MNPAVGLRTLGLFARYPVPGQTKTRLAATVGAGLAAELSACFLRDLMSRGPQLADVFVVAATPESAESVTWFQSQCRPPTRLLFQPEGDLGQRISWFFRVMRQEGHQEVVLTGSDSPDLPTSLVADAFTTLRNRDAVLAPAADGGFVLIGLSCDPDGLFEDIRWSTSSTREDTILALQRAGKSVGILKSWYDVDTVDDLRELAWRLSRGIDGEMRPAECPLTRARLEGLL